MRIAVVQLKYQIRVTKHADDSVLVDMTYFKSVMIVTETEFVKDLVSEENAKVLDRLVTLDGESVNRTAFLYVIRYPYERFAYQLDLRDW